MLNIFVAKVSYLKLDLATFLNKISQTHLLLAEVVARGSSVKKVLLKISQNLRENIGARVSSSIRFQAQAFIKKETLAQVFSYEFVKIVSTRCFKEHPRATASVFRLFQSMNCAYFNSFLCSVDSTKKNLGPSFRSSHQRCSIKRLFLNFRKIRRKKAVLESPF